MAFTFRDKQRSVVEAGGVSNGTPEDDTASGYLDPMGGQVGPDDVWQVETINIVGANQEPVFTGDDTGNVVEAGGTLNGTAGTPAATGTLIATDPDADESGFQAGTIGGLYGSLLINAAGEWTYTLDDDDAD